MSNWARVLSIPSGWLAPINAEVSRQPEKEPINIGFSTRAVAAAMAESVSGWAIITHMESVARKVPNRGLDYMPRVPEFFP
jgi:hypothetical protein